MFPLQILGAFTHSYLSWGNIWFISICPILDTGVIFSRHFHHTHCPCLIQTSASLFPYESRSRQNVKILACRKEERKARECIYNYSSCSALLQYTQQIRADSTQPVLTAIEAAFEKQTLSPKVQINMVVSSSKCCQSMPSPFFYLHVETEQL